MSAPSLRVKLVDPAAFTLVYDHALAQALSKRGVAVTLATCHFPHDAIPRHSYEVELGFYRHRVGSPGSRVERASRVAQHCTNMSRLGRLAGSNEILHFQWFALQELDLVARPRGRPLIFTAHDVVPRERRLWQSAAQRRLVRAADAVIVHYKLGRRRLLDAGVMPERIHVIPIGVYSHLATPVKRATLPAELSETDVPVVLFQGVLRPNKGLDVLLDAWRQVHDAELWIVGQPRMDISELRRRAPASVRFVDRWVREDELAGLFERAALTVLPYRAIDQSGVAFAAMAFGCPLLLSDAGGFPDIADYGAARIVPAGDADALAEALLELLADEHARDRLADAARAAARGVFSWPEVARQTEDLYRQVASAY